MRDYFLASAASLSSEGQNYTLKKLPFIFLPVTISLIEDVLCRLPEVCICWWNCHCACYLKKGKKRKIIYWSSYHVTLEWTVHVISGFKVLGQPELKLVVKKGILLFSSSYWLPGICIPILLSLSPSLMCENLNENPHLFSYKMSFRLDWFKWFELPGAVCQETWVVRSPLLSDSSVTSDQCQG